MAGYIENSVVESLWSGYNSGRAGTAEWSGSGIVAGQWSSVMDNTTCDWCGWADERIFDVKVEPYDPPMHFGCRCIVGYIRADEFPPDLTWGKGPPKSSYPPGSSGGFKDGKPTLRNQPNKNLSKMNPNKTKLDRAAKNHEDLFEPKFFTPKNHDDFVKWHKESLRELSQLSDEAFDEIYALLNETVTSWSGSSSGLIADLWETAISGQIDEFKILLEKFSEWSVISNATINSVKFGKYTFDDIASIFQAQKQLTVAVESAKSLEIVLYRGVSIGRTRPGYEPNLLTVFKQSVTKGDLEQSLGTKFIESWTTDRKIAFEFSNKNGMIFKKAVDADDLLLSYQTHPGFQAFANEREFLWQNFDRTIVPKSVTVPPNIRFGRTEIEVW